MALFCHDGLGLLSVWLFFHCYAMALFIVMALFCVLALFERYGSFWLWLFFYQMALFISMALFDCYGFFWSFWLFLIVMALFDLYGPFLSLWLFRIVRYYNDCNLLTDHYHKASSLLLSYTSISKHNKCGPWRCKLHHFLKHNLEIETVL